MRGRGIALAAGVSVAAVVIAAVVLLRHDSVAPLAGSGVPADVPHPSSAVSQLLDTGGLPWDSTLSAEHVSADPEDGLVAVARDAEASARLARLLREAQTAVDMAIRSAAPVLVAYLPDTQADFRAALGTPAGAYPDVAAVTTTLGGSTSPDGTELILLNPRVVATLTPKALRVVVIHEATHVATDAIDTDGPLWLEEGFADYVALHAVTVPTKDAAAEAVTWLASHPVPRTWPSDAGFEGGRAQVAYELAWLGVRQLVADFGVHRFVRFYLAVVGGIPLDQAAKQLLGTTQARLESGYRELIGKLAHGD